MGSAHDAHPHNTSPPDPTWNVGLSKPPGAVSPERRATHIHKEPDLQTAIDPLTMPETDDAIQWPNPIIRAESPPGPVSPRFYLGLVWMCLRQGIPDGHPPVTPPGPRQPVTSIGSTTRNVADLPPHCVRTTPAFALTPVVMLSATTRLLPHSEMPPWSERRPALSAAQRSRMGPLFGSETVRTTYPVNRPGPSVTLSRSEEW